jgi:hypothetical protein
MRHDLAIGLGARHFSLQRRYRTLQFGELPAATQRNLTQFGANRGSFALERQPAAVWRLRASGLLDQFITPREVSSW